MLVWRSLNLEYTIMQFPHATTETFVSLNFFLQNYFSAPDIHVGLCELVVLEAEAVDEVLAHLLHLIVRKHLEFVKNCYQHTRTDCQL